MTVSTEKMRITDKVNIFILPELPKRPHRFLGNRVK